MSDLISRESAIVRVSKVIWDDLVAHDVKEELKALPSAVVHCKDCIRRNSDRCPFNREYHAEGINIALDYTKDDGFCHWGEEEKDGFNQQAGCD